VIRERPDVRHYVAAYRPVDRSTSLRAEQFIRLNGWDAPRGWPDLMRRVSIRDLEQSLRLAFWNSQWTLLAATISPLYRQCWQIEMFFRWLNQRLRIRTFYGTPQNAVRVQLWSAIRAYPRHRDHPQRTRNQHQPYDLRPGSLGSRNFPSALSLLSYES
jgi:IS4 transposase